MFLFGFLLTNTRANFLCETETYGTVDGERFSNFAMIQELGPQYTLWGHRTCTDERGYIAGVQFILRDKDDPSFIRASEIGTAFDPYTTLRLEPMGDVSSWEEDNCLERQIFRFMETEASYDNTEERISEIGYRYRANKPSVNEQYFAPVTLWE